MKAEAHNPVLDGWRGLAILCVLVSHTLRWQYGLGEGFWGNLGTVGVELFFVLSGFLITRNLLEISSADSLRPALGAFYIRRVFRILPALLAFLAAAALALRVGISHSEKPVPAAEWLSCVLLWRNYLPEGHGLTDHIWSLSVEEHTYLVLGLLLTLAPRKLPSLLGLLGLTAAIAIASFWHLGSLPLHLAWQSQVRMFSPLCGAILALSIDRDGVRAALARLEPASLIAAGALAWCALEAPFGMLAGTPLFALALGAIQHRRKNFLASVLATRAFVGIGLLSYSLYLWQQPVLLHVHVKAAAHASWLARIAVSIMGLAVVGGVAALSYALVEKPARRFGRKVAAKVGSRA
ncbi:MAG: acyltransferase, partial [Verrucomicrobiae bacterium]|nr:acyltransferase [Verrucomicrobiae bacterium]